MSVKSIVCFLRWFSVMFLGTLTWGFVIPNAAVTLNDNRLFAATHHSGARAQAGSFHQDDFSNNNEKKKKKKKKKLDPNKPTLYEILGAAPNATRQELKQAYVAMAKKTHPDATKSHTESHDFAEIAAAYKTLSNPKLRQKYDRQLLAQGITSDISKVANDISDNLAPAAQKFEEWAMPFVERAAATTFVSFQAAAQDLTKGGKSDLKSAIGAGIKAGKHANKVIDRLALADKSKELTERAMNQTQESLKLRQELTTLVDERLQLALRIPNSGLSSADATKLLDGLNTEDTLSIMDRARRIHRIVYEIAGLEQIESEYKEKLEEHTAVEQNLHFLNKNLLEAKTEAKQALLAEREAQRMLEKCRARVQETTLALHELSSSVDVVSVKHKRASGQLEKATSGLEKRQERVRQALWRKQQMLENAMQKQDPNYLPLQEGTEEDRIRLEQLQREEAALLAESARLEQVAQRMQSRAQKINQQAHQIELEQVARKMQSRAENLADKMEQP